MKKLYESLKNPGMLSSYSALAAAFLAAGSAQGQVVYNDIDDVTLSQGDTLSMDLDGDGTADFFFRVGEASTAGSWTFGSMLGDISSLGIGGSMNKAMASTGPYFYYALALNYGDNIGASGNFPGVSAYGNAAVFASDYYGSFYGNFGNAGDKYVGFQFMIGSDLHYGWMRVNVTIAPINITIKDYAYETNANMALDAGDTMEISAGIAENISGSISAYSFGKNIQLSMQEAYAQHADVRILNMAGQTVYTAEVNPGHTSIDMGNVPDGAYLMEVMTGKNTWTKKLFLGD